MGRTMLLGACALLAVTSSVRAATSYSFEVLRDNPRFYWNFDETSGNALEQVRSFANHELAPIAGAGRVEHGTIGSGLHLGSAVSLDGALQQFRAANLADGEMAGAWAIELWAQAQGPGITPAGSSGQRQDYLVNPGDAGTNNPAVIYDYTNDNRVGLFSGAGRTDNVAGAPTIDDEDWHHMVFTFYGNGGGFGVADRVDVAIDGVVSTIPRGGFSAGFNLNNGMIIGSALTNGAGGFEGRIDEVAFYDLSGLGEMEVAARVSDLANHYSLAQTLAGESNLFVVDPAQISYTYDPAGVQPNPNNLRDDNAAGGVGMGKLIDGVIAATNTGANLSDGSTIGFNDPSGFNGDNGAPHPGVTFDLGGLMPLDQVWIDYIGAGGLAGVEAPESVELSFSTDGVNFGTPLVFDDFNDTLLGFGGGMFSSRRLVAEVDGALASHVRLNFFNDQEWTFLSEVQFVAVAIPEPTSAALLGLAGLAMMRRRGRAQG